MCGFEDVRLSGPNIQSPPVYPGCCAARWENIRRQRGPIPEPLRGWSVYQGISHTFWKVTCHTRGPVTRVYRGHRAPWVQERVHPQGPANWPFLSLAPCFSLSQLHSSHAAVLAAALTSAWHICVSTGAVTTTQACLYMSGGNSALREYISWEKPALLLVKCPLSPPPPITESYTWYFARSPNFREI